MSDDARERVDETRKTKLVQFREKLSDIDAELIPLGEKELLTEAETTRWEELVAERAIIEPEYRKLEDRLAFVDEVKAKTYREIRGMPEIKKPVEELFGRDVVSMDWRACRDGALKILDDKESVGNAGLRSHQVDLLDRQLRQEAKTDLARRMIVTENPHYRTAFQKLMTSPDASNYLTVEEREAMFAYGQYRAAERAQSESVGSGGYAIPVLIDPSIILTDQETLNPFLTLARTIDINTNAWKGVSSAGMTWSFDPEASEVSDDSLTSIVQPTVTIFMARGFIPFSIEIEQDWPGFQAEMARILAFGYDELLVSKFSTGNGTSEPRGILTALAAAAPTVTVTSTTDGAFGQEDVYASWKALPQKYRARASWMMSVGVMNKVRQFGAANVYHAYTIGLMQGAVENLFARPVFENAYFPDFTGTTGSENRLVVGDWDNYVIARRSGMTVELVPQLLHTSNNRPMGSRGWFAYARIGGNSVNDAAFRLQANT
jgi:HK97 family phage major capsid protein